MADLRTLAAPRLTGVAAMPSRGPVLRAQFVRYAGAGAIGTAVQYLALVALVHAQWTGAVAASTAGAVLGALVNYVLNYRFTFASGRTHAHALPRFAAVAALGIGINALVVALLIHAGAHYLVAQVVATG